MSASLCCAGSLWIHNSPASALGIPEIVSVRFRLHLLVAVVATKSHCKEYGQGAKWRIGDVFYSQSTTESLGKLFK
jgi:hypothetical protein